MNCIVGKCIFAALFFSAFCYVLHHFVLQYSLKKTTETLISSGHSVNKTQTNRSSEKFLLTAVESLDAKVISRFPFSPSRAGTKIKISEMSL